MRTVQTLADSLCVILVADFLRFILNHCKEIRMEMFIMTSESCAMMYLAGKKPCQCVSHYFRCRGHSLLHRTVRGAAARVVRTQIFMSVWEHNYLQYSWIVLSHCLTVTAVSRVSVDKFLVSLVSNDHISNRDDFIFSLLNRTWRVEWAKSYRVTLCQHNYQLSSVTLFVLFLILATLYETSVQFRIKVIGAETQADLKLRYVNQFK